MIELIPVFSPLRAYQKQCSNIIVQGTTSTKQRCLIKLGNALLQWEITCNI
ncbi:MAG: hypothetical protein ACTMUB_07215 [cyanobacterium endosymbiont of Rhopalodia musculus]|uniref:hypothetical protein n=1 Tax=cyanobacterium endosymbiont of Epithemia clementina EcSB TaxID=3034674 RepID=UPI002480A495|nr:hypothetical protein [cyanobacterium endosymbiont of Epithemia clementina EcSB]WGT67888.1 hypothetical protein P3F56_02030 [cyanobacterium endosymbiont of Epithemia clementina EcSB]